MTRPAARQGDPVTGADMHEVLVPSPPGSPVPRTLSHPFSGHIAERVSTVVLIGGAAAATVGSVARNVPPHIPTPPGTSFVRPPSNRGTVQTGSATVFIDGKAAARQGDTVRTCNDPTDLPAGTVTAGCPSVLVT